MDKQEYYLTEAASEFGVTQNTVTDLVRTLKIPFTQCKRNGNGKLLDHVGMKMLGNAIGKPWPLAATKTPVKS